jgi:HEAT repeat protein
MFCVAGFLEAAEDDPGDEQIQLLIEFISDADRETRAIGLQYVREEVPGEAATKRFAALLGDLSAEGQIDLLDALGDRGDPAARPAVLETLKNDEEAVRAAAIRALGALGSPSDVALLAGKTAADSPLERGAARQSLIRLRGDDVNAAILAVADEGESGVRVELLGVLAARNAKEALPSVLKSTDSEEASVRIAAIEALRFLADENDTPSIVNILKGARDDVERGKVELTLLTVASRGRQKCAEAIIAGLGDAKVEARVVMLRALARAGGPEALAAIVAHLQDFNKAARDEAVRMLAGWPDEAAAPHLVKIAASDKDLRHQVVAIRGLVRLASPQGDKPADMELLAEVFNLASRPQEKRLVAGVLGGVATPQSLAVVLAILEDEALVEEAGLAAVLIAEKMEGGDKAQIRKAMEKVSQVVKGSPIRDRAQKVLKSP